MVTHLTLEELGAGDRGVEVPRLLQRSAGLREGADHQRVPAGQALVVERWAHALFARCQQALANALRV